jgi:hypothetical protein
MVAKVAIIHVEATIPVATRAAPERKYRSLPKREPLKGLTSSNASTANAMILVFQTRYAGRRL